MSDANPTVSSKHPRPLSPHLQIYRPQITSVLSIFHRATGVGLAMGLLLLVAWVTSAAMGLEAYETLQSYIGSPVGILLLMGWSWALLYHLCTGIRHLIWDVGAGLELPQVYRSGYAALIISSALTLIVWIIAFVRFS